MKLKAICRGKKNGLLLLLAMLLVAFALLSAAWYVTAYRPYDDYVEALRAQPGFREDPGFPECGVDGEGCTCNVARASFLHWPSAVYRPGRDLYPLRRRGGGRCQPGGAGGPPGERGDAAVPGPGDLGDPVTCAARRPLGRYRNRRPAGKTPAGRLPVQMHSFVFT